MVGNKTTVQVHNSIKIFVVCLLLSVIIFVYSKYNPATNPLFPACPFYTLTGLFCPGCGAQRALHQLLHGHILPAIHFNLLLVLYLPYILFYYFVEVLHFVFKKKIIEFNLPNKVWFISGTLLIVVAFFVVRNLHNPIGYSLSPH